MLTEKQYQALCKYRDNFVSASGKPGDITLDLCNRGLIRPKKVEYTIENECLVSYQKVFWELTASGKMELDEHESYMCKKRAKEEADKVKEKTQRTKNRFDMVAFGAISATIGGLVVYYWPEIITYFSHFFH